VKKALGGVLVAAALDQDIKYVAMLINGSPEVVQFASDADEHLVQEPPVSRLWPALLEELGVALPEAQAPPADGLIADDNAPRGQDQFDFPQAQAEAVIQPDRLVDDYGWKAATAVRIGGRAYARDPAIGADLFQLDSTGTNTSGI
jgi:hypothetical protein